jgi:hypothetical protein
MRTQGIEQSANIEGASIHGLEDEQATANLFIGSTTEPNSGLALLASEPRFPRAA